ncbi:hypothetical protein EG328_003929, partial [Venturia inaequalis]
MVLLRTISNMHFLPAILALSLYASEAAAQDQRSTKCYLDRTNGGKTWFPTANCDLLPHNLYLCAHGTTV